MNRYALSADELIARTAALVASVPAGVPARHRFITVEVEGADPPSDVGRDIERRVFEERFGNDAEEMQREYGPYEDASRFFIVVDRQQQRAAGLMRIIYASAQGLKAFNDLAREPFSLSVEQAVSAHGLPADLAATWELGTVAVLPEYRSGTGAASIQIYRAVYLAALRDRIDHFVSVIDSVPLAKITEYVGLPFVPLASVAAAPYLGSTSSQPIYGYVPDFYRLMNRKRYTWRGFLARKALG